MAGRERAPIGFRCGVFAKRVRSSRFGIGLSIRWPSPRKKKRDRWVMDLGLAMSGVVTFNRELASSMVHLGYRKFRTGLLSDALTAFMEARRLTPEDPYVHYLIGKTLLKFGRPREARTSFKQAIRLC